MEEKRQLEITETYVFPGSLSPEDIVRFIANHMTREESFAGLIFASIAVYAHQKGIEPDELAAVLVDVMTNDKPADN